MSLLYFNQHTLMIRPGVFYGSAGARWHFHLSSNKKALLGTIIELAFSNFTVDALLV
jgi:hypothetical protein